MKGGDRSMFSHTKEQKERWGKKHIFYIRMHGLNPFSFIFNIFRIPTTTPSRLFPLVHTNLGYFFFFFFLVFLCKNSDPCYNPFQVIPTLSAQTRPMNIFFWSNVNSRISEQFNWYLRKLSTILAYSEWENHVKTLNMFFVTKNLKVTGIIK